MKKQHEDNIDNLFDKAFDDYRVEPSDQVWKNVKKQMPLFTETSASQKGFSSKKYFLIFAAAFVVIASSIFLYLKNNNIETKKSVQYNSNENKNDVKSTANNNGNSKVNNGAISNENKIIANNNPTQSEKEINVKTSNQNSNLSVAYKSSKQDSEKTNQRIHTNISNEKEIVKENNYYSTTDNLTKSVNSQNNIYSSNDKIDKPKTNNKIENKNVSQNINDNKNSGQYQAQIINKTGDSIAYNNYSANTNDNKSLNNDKNNYNSISDKITKPNDKFLKIAILKIKPLSQSETKLVIDEVNTTDAANQPNNHIVRPRIYIGIHYTPEIIFNLPELNSPVNVKKNNFTQSGHLSVNYDFRHLIFQTGLGYSFYNNQTTNNVKYISRDSVGFYEDVISYSIDSNHIVYNTAPKNIYDSVKHSKYIVTNNSYRYFQIPLWIGYKGYIKKFSFTVRSGVGIGILSYKKVAEVPFNVNNAELLSIENNTPALTKTYWQFLFNIGIGYQLTNSISIAVEPSFKYYLSPFYENGNTKKYPYSIGLKTGVYFHF